MELTTYRTRPSSLLHSPQPFALRIICVRPIHLRDVIGVVLSVQLLLHSLSGPDDGQSDTAIDDHEPGWIRRKMSSACPRSDQRRPETQNLTPKITHGGNAVSDSRSSHGSYIAEEQVNASDSVAEVVNNLATGLRCARGVLESAVEIGSASQVLVLPAAQRRAVGVDPFLGISSFELALAAAATPRLG